MHRRYSDTYLLKLWGKLLYGARNVKQYVHYLIIRIATLFFKKKSIFFGRCKKNGIYDHLKKGNIIKIVEHRLLEFFYEANFVIITY